MSMRKLYLRTVTPEEALGTYISAVSTLAVRTSETIPVRESFGRVTETAVFAKCCSPLFNAAAMDGIAVISSHTKGASETSPAELKEGEDYLPVDTGDPVKPPYDAVIMAEELLETGSKDRVRILSSVPAWQYVRPVGEDIAEGEMILHGLHKIIPADLGVLLSGGVTQISVLRRPRVGIIPTGTEIMEPEEAADPAKTLPEGSILESNSRMFAALTEEAGGIPLRYGIVKDDYGEIREAVRKALKENDMVILNAGSSAGREDYSEPVLEELGKVFVHGVSMKPGKPVILAEASGKPVIGLPGYPVSAYLDFRKFAVPVMNLFSGENQKTPRSVKARLSGRLVSSLKNEEYVQVKIGEVHDRYIASPLARGAASAMSLVRADGFCVIPRSREGFEAGEEVTVELYRTPDEIGHTLVSIGSHDPIMDVIADLMTKESPGTFLSSTHVGSLGGLMALKRGEAHLAPTHLLDEETGLYNIPVMRKMFPDRKMVLVKGVVRIQGILVQKGNPLGIRGIGDLKKCRYINRQRGAGTRVLFDYQLKKLGIRPEEISGYETEASTHMAVAALIKNGGADAGMGIYSAAHAMGLDFLPVGSEEYQFAMEKETLELPMMQTFLKILKSEEFRRTLDKMGGYDTSESGETAWES
ncbi:MAG: molybdopterin biosynthesis protein [Lachnospiraceae bacterium]|jgi:putative molybdopterin biosynthesis protein|nr:molybdopterin biosynthesis protein [Lachnospiraceae bacterium]